MVSVRKFLIKAGVTHDEIKSFYGEVIGLKDTITFQASNAEELEKAFRDSIDIYLAWCKELGEKPF